VDTDSKRSKFFYFVKKCYICLIIPPRKAANTSSQQAEMAIVPLSLLPIYGNSLKCQNTERDQLISDHFQLNGPTLPVGLSIIYDQCALLHDGIKEAQRDEYKILFVNWINSAISDAHDDQKVESIPGYFLNCKEFKTSWKACRTDAELVFDIVSLVFNLLLKSDHEETQGFYRHIRDQSRLVYSPSGILHN